MSLLTCNVQSINFSATPLFNNVSLLHDFLPFLEKTEKKKNSREIFHCLVEARKNRFSRVVNYESLVREKDFYTDSTKIMSILKSADPMLLILSTEKDFLLDPSKERIHVQEVKHKFNVFKDLLEKIPTDHSDRVYFCAKEKLEQFLEPLFSTHLQAMCRTYLAKITLRRLKLRKILLKISTRILQKIWRKMLLRINIKKQNRKRRAKYLNAEVKELESDESFGSFVFHDETDSETASRVSSTRRSHSARIQRKKASSEHSSRPNSPSDLSELDLNEVFVKEPEDLNVLFDSASQNKINQFSEEIIIEVPNVPEKKHVTLPSTQTSSSESEEMENDGKSYKIFKSYYKKSLREAATKKRKKTKKIEKTEKTEKPIDKNQKPFHAPQKKSKPTILPQIKKPKPVEVKRFRQIPQTLEKKVEKPIMRMKIRVLSEPTINEEVIQKKIELEPVKTRYAWDLETKPLLKLQDSGTVFPPMPKYKEQNYKEKALVRHIIDHGTKMKLPNTVGNSIVGILSKE